MERYWKKQEQQKLKDIEQFINRSCSIAFGNKAEKVESLDTRNHGDDFDAFRISLKPNLDDGLDGNEIQTFFECFKLANSPGYIEDSTFYARENQFVIVIALKRNSN